MNTIERAPFHFELEDVYLSSGFSGKIVSCTEGGKGALTANVDRANTWETIVPEPQADGTVAFRSKFSNLYISVVDGTDRLVPSVSWIREWEKFRAFRCDSEDDTAFVLQSCKNGKFVRVYVNSDPAYLVADCDNPDTWEQFRLHPIRRFQADNLNAARSTGANGIVLLKNDENMLPVAPDSEIVLLGVTGYSCHRMGTGSGDMLAQNTMKHVSQSVVPAPRCSSKVKDELFVLKPETRIGWQGENAREMAELLADYLRPATGYELPVAEGPGDITLEATDPSPKTDEAGFVSEQYALSVRAAGIHLRAENDFGLARAIQTLRQLFPATVFSTKVTDTTPWVVEGVDIEDSPKSRWRGQHLDVSRHFFTREEVERFIELLAQHKLNIFHWHLTDDQGWRIEIKKYPKLTQIGSIRKETLVGRDYDQTDCQYDGTPYGGYYTQEDIRHVVEFARRRRITIVPEIDMPGHMAAAITAYPELGNYPDRQIQVRTRWGISKETLNCNEATIRFCKDVWEAVMALFPSKFLHIGGDEAPHDEWEECGAAAKLGLPSTADIQPRFTAELVRFFGEHGRRLIGWDEIAENGSAPDNAAIMWWRRNGIGMQALTAGHDVVYANSRHLYFDSYYDDADKESGAVPRTFDRFVNERCIFDAVGQIDTRMLGAQGQLWTEYIPNMRVLENRAFPRIAAMAEALWALPHDFADFTKRMQRQNVRYFVQKVNVYIPDCIPLVDNGSQMVDIPDGTVCLVAKNVNKIVTCEDRGRAPLAATLGAFDNNHGESMVVEKQPDGSVAFKNVCTGKYISVTDDGSLLKAEGSRADLWELFDIYPYGHFDGGFVLRSRKNGKFVTVDESSGNRLAAICDGTPRSREVFSFLNHR